MGNSSSGGGEPSLANQVASCSISSLDIQLLLSVNHTQSLLTESATLGSFCSDDSDSPPALPPFRKVPGFSLIGLGDNLKLFSTTISQPTEECEQSTVLITVPTFPRLKCMIKECLSITKWAQSSTGRQPPNHTPWTNVHLRPVREWTPEGSFFAPENFLHALLQSRRDKSTACITCLDDPADDFHEDIPLCHSDGNVMLFYQVGDPENVKSLGRPDFPQEIHTNLGLQATSTKLSLPSLVVSNSYYSFPIPYESSESALAGIGTLTHHRGKRGPSPKESLSSTVYADDKPGLCFEEMIKNLRLQCSTLELQIPAADSTWNSRSPEPLSYTACSDDRSESSEKNNTRVSLHKSVHLRVRSVSVSTSPDTVPESSLRESVFRRLHFHGKLTHTLTEEKQEVKIVEVEMKGSMGRSDDALITCPAPWQLRSAMVKSSSLKGKCPFKKVRFAVLECDPQPEHIQNFQEGREIARFEVDDSQGNGGRNIARNDRKQVPPLQRSATWSQRPPWKELRRVRSACSNSPRSHSLLVNSFTPSKSEEHNTELEAKNVNKQSGGTLSYSTSSLGRHSLSRIIKGPMFSGRDGRRATCALSGHEVDENAARRENHSHSEGRQKKKSRMPIPLRSILTRFK